MLALKVKKNIVFPHFFCCSMNVFLQNPVCRSACLTPAFIQKGFVTDSQEIEFPSEQGNKHKITPAVN